MFKYNFSLRLFISLFLVSFLSCTQSKEQEEFEKEAYSLPENITETDNNGSIVDNHTDPDDWRIAPFFQGIITIDPPFPNPLLTNQRLTIEIDAGLDGASGLRIYALDNESSIRFLREYPSSPLPPGLTSVSLDALEIARIVEQPEGIYRLIIEDRQQRVISYGDVKIE